MSGTLARVVGKSDSPTKRSPRDFPPGCMGRDGEYPTGSPRRTQKKRERESTEAGGEPRQVRESPARAHVIIRPGLGAGEVSVENRKKDLSSSCHPARGWLSDFETSAFVFGPSVV